METASLEVPRKQSLMESVLIAEKLDTKWLIVGRKKRTNTRGQRDTKLQMIELVEMKRELQRLTWADPKIEFLLCGMTFPSDVGFLNDPNVWIADTAATVHMTPHRTGLTNIRKAKASDSITMGNGKEESALEIADIVGTICDRHGNEIATGKLSDVTVLPTGKYNLFSVTQMLKKGWELRGNDQKMTLVKGDSEISFDIQIPTPKGMLFAMYVKRHENREVGNALRDGGIVKMTFNEAHDKLGHMSNILTKATARQLGWHLTGAVRPCESCAKAKAKQKNVPKKSEHQVATANGQRIFLDISSVKMIENSDKTASRPFWRIMVDERTQLKFSDFFDTKDGMVEPTCEQLYRWMRNGKVVKYIRLDDAGENKALPGTRAERSMETQH